MKQTLLIAAAFPVTLAGCSLADSQSAGPATSAPQQVFWDRLASHCGPNGVGRAYSGELVSDDARDADWKGRAMIAHWADCDEDRIAIAFHTQAPDRDDGWDRSRTWVVTRAGEGAAMRLTLKHDHRHDDATADAVTFYGGTTEDAGTPNAQDFAVDQESIALFEQEGLDASLTNVWRLEASPARAQDAHFTYQLTRRNDATRLFRVRFNTSEPVDAPPPAWGWE